MPVYDDHSPFPKGEEYLMSEFVHEVNMTPEEQIALEDQHQAYTGQDHIKLALVRRSAQSLVERHASPEKYNYFQIPGTTRESPDFVPPAVLMSREEQIALTDFHALPVIADAAARPELMAGDQDTMKTYRRLTL